MIGKISKTLEITWELIQYIVIEVRKYLNLWLGLHQGQSYTFTKVLKGGIKGRLISPKA